MCFGKGRKLKMNVVLPEKEKIPKKRIIIYVTIIIICIIAIAVVIGVQVLGNDIVDNIFGINKITKRSEEEEAELKTNFENIFDNNTEYKEEYQVQKADDNKDIIYTNYSKQEKTANYEINVNLPYINIKNESVKKFNKEIESTFKEKAEEITKSTNKNIIYTVKYKASINKNIMSLIIYSDLKQETSAQRVIIQTFNYDLSNNKEFTLENTIENYKITKNEVQEKINKDIKEEQRRAEELKKLGYNIFTRDIDSDMYKVENISEYFIYNNNIYIIFAYGNDKITSEMDLVII